MLEKKYDFKIIEPMMQQAWLDEDIYRFDPNSAKEVYSIDTPPPTVNGKIHIGHLSSYSHIDMMARYKRMRGFSVFYPFGFDDNGLPTERLVEKNLGKRANEMPREEFVQHCLEETEALEAKFKVLFTQMGQSADWHYLYSTINDHSRKTAQMSFIDLYKKGRLYHADKPALWCTECRTSIAQAELETKELESVFNYIKFFVEGSADEYLEVATTRPELLPACVCVFINPDDERHKKYIGKNVVVPGFGFTVPVLADEKADLEKGTGVVMCCTFGDQTDLEWYEKYHLPYKEAFDAQGCMTEIAGKYAGMYSLKARKAIVEDLKSAELLYKQEPIVHAVAVHERCGTPMEILGKKQWFIRTIEYKDDFLRLGDEINWYPSNMRNRYKSWVENIQWDWCISRQRYFGVMFPVWYCKNCGKIMLADESQLPIDPTVTQPGKRCECGCDEFNPETDIMDTWMTSSVSPLINLNWAEDFNAKMFPMSLRANAHDIIRTWDFYTIVKGFHHCNSKPWSDVMVSGFVMASKTEKISKRKDNAKMEPQFLLDTYSSDVTRYWTTGSSGGSDVVFSEDAFKRGKKLVTKIYNAVKFSYTFLQSEGYTYIPDDNTELLPMDKWIITIYNDMCLRYMKQMDAYELSSALSTIERFFWNYCDNYMEIVKRRLYNPEIYGDEAKLSGLYAMSKVLRGILQCFAPFMPHITDYLYREYYSKVDNVRSIHLTQLGTINGADESCVNGGDQFIEILGLIRREKSEANYPANASIKHCRVECSLPSFIESASQDLKAVACIENLDIVEADSPKVRVEFAPLAES